MTKNRIFLIWIIRDKLKSCWMSFWEYLTIHHFTSVHFLQSLSEFKHVRLRILNTKTSLSSFKEQFLLLYVKTQNKVCLQNALGISTIFSNRLNTDWLPLGLLFIKTKEATDWSCSLKSLWLLHRHTCYLPFLTVSKKCLKAYG